MTTENTSFRALVLDALAIVSRSNVVDMNDSTTVLDLNMDSLSLVAMLSLIEARRGIRFDSEAIAEILRAANIGELIAVIESRVAAARSICAE